jgi:4-hydroxythreonine-4-phosphate dehydrogenase
MSTQHKPIIGITLGDINGIGPEVILKTVADQRLSDHATLVIYGASKVLSFYRKHLNLEEVNYVTVKEAHVFDRKKVNVVNCWEHEVEINIGKETKEGGNCAWLALKKSTADLKEGFIDALVTGPINKANIQSEEFTFPGHTEYFMHATGATSNLMFMISEAMRVGVVTGHIPLGEVANQITKEKIETALEVMNASLKNDFAITKPRIAVLGLNPHAGENGLLGKEEIEFIEPVTIDQRKRGNLVYGPFSADGFFGSGEFAKYDGILAMYHDQGLIPFKSLSFGNGVNYTAGLPVIRTSPDHGTAYNIAGKGLASADSLRNAIFLAADVAKNRRESVVVTD